MKTCDLKQNDGGLQIFYIDCMAFGENNVQPIDESFFENL